MTVSAEGRKLLRVVPTGTHSDGHQLDPRPGRYAVYGADEGRYLYVPEVQELFSVRDELADLLVAAKVDAVTAAATGEFSPESQAAYAFVSALVRECNLKPLTERRTAHRGLRDVVVHVSQLCNLGCVYCYAVELNKAMATMTLDTADAVVARTMQLAPEGLASVKFLGGEPTLAWPIIERLMERYEQEHAALDLPKPVFTMVTNGTRMNATMIASAATHGMYVLVSVDGPKSIHDKLRPTLGGQGTYDRATRTVKALAEAGVDVSIESVYTRQHFLAGVTPQDMIDHFLSLGIRRFHIPPAIGAWHGEDTYEEMAEVTSAYVAAARASIRSFRGPNPYLLRGIQFILDGFAIRERRRHVCGAGRTFMGINYDGEAFPCYLLQSSEVSYGLVSQSWDQERYEGVRSRFERNGKQYHPVCRECWANEICQSCLGTSWHLSPEITKPPAYFCAFQKTLIGSVLAEIGAARESGDWDMFVANWERHLAPLVESVAP
ncbi:uncharacterized protein FHT40_006079 [Mycolicibacterium sp. BK556]|uniref:radical SAM/SPASM domain-containing protein n=1 Tax=unclassified Mycolicibacterium TaxID=2636767 RepID=UPI001608CF29|nr:MULTISPECIES: radical SAM protein [unclassified Mycolicibacterium]MBB3606388.1 uncharacterized protein [Mycolicibacterium sp. BK556]MBB3636366.1 uncharacterized protein [Mycolicibacterium sp. BK607]